MDDDDYIQKKEYKLSIFKANKETVICTYEKDMDDIEANLERKFLNIKYGEIN